MIRRFWMMALVAVTGFAWQRSFAQSAPGDTSQAAWSDSLRLPCFTVPLHQGMRPEELKSAYSDSTRPLSAKPASGAVLQLSAEGSLLSRTFTFVDGRLVEVYLSGPAAALLAPDIKSIERQVRSLPATRTAYTNWSDSLKGKGTRETWKTPGMSFKRTWDWDLANGTNADSELISYRISFTRPIAAQEDSVPPLGTLTLFETPPKPLPDCSPQPAFPSSAKEARVAGKVMVEVYVDQHGDVRKWKIIKADPQGMGFEEAVLEVIPQWRFTPAIQKGQPVGVWVAIPFNFKYRPGENPPIHRVSPRHR